MTKQRKHGRALRKRARAAIASASPGSLTQPDTRYMPTRDGQPIAAMELLTLGALRERLNAKAPQP